MINRFNDNLIIMKNLCESLRILANHAIEESNDDGCKALYNDMIKDLSSYIDEIGLEIDRHKQKGKWE